jgi:hypothetical protein
VKEAREIWFFFPNGYHQMIETRAAAKGTSQGQHLALLTPV